MPTYQLHSSQTSPINDQGVTFFPGQQIVTHTFVTETILTFSDTGDFVVGETVTEADSAETGVIYWKTATQLGLLALSDSFVGGKAITGGTSAEELTPTGVANRVVRTAATPLLTNLIIAHDVTSTGSSDDQTICLDERTNCVRIWKVTGGNVTACNESTAVILNVIPIGSIWTLTLNHAVSKIILQFDAAGSCRLDEYAVNGVADIDLA